ncbi:MAG: right-handed parallel beta-helix repeat-containing protein [Phycisphaerae bacterium]|nr:right-handed parallel beta-helix repeat-containing protein [Phycisphaerae bacterium]
MSDLSLYYAKFSKIANCTFLGNSASYGGGIYNLNSSPEVTNCTFIGNSAVSMGGGMCNWEQSNPAVTNCIFSNNSAQDWGGGGMYDADSSGPKLINCTFSANFGRYGGGIFPGKSASVTNCILWGNTATTSGAQIMELADGGITYSDIQGGYIGTGNINADPLFIDARTGDLRLQAGSPCIDRGSSVAVPQAVTTDLAGNPRICGALMDMGAYEVCGRPKVSMPTFAPDGGSLAADKQITITCSAVGAVIHYTTDGSEPTENSATVESGARLSLGSSRPATLKARAWKQNWEPSDVTTAVYDEPLVMVIHVSATGDDSQNGLDWATAKQTLQAGLDAATYGHEIWVAAGTYKPTVKVGGTTERHKAFRLEEGIAIYGGFTGGEGRREDRDWHTNQTILSGDLLGNDGNSSGINELPRQDNCYRVIVCVYETVHARTVIDGFIIAGGNANDQSYPKCGGGISSDRVTLMISNCIFRGNSASDAGGGIFTGFGSVTVTNCTFDRNRAELGGGMYNQGALTMTNCTFAGNTATEGGSPSDYKGGGGMANANNSPTLTNCVFAGNSSAIWNWLDWLGNPVATVTYSNVQGGYAGKGNINADPMFVNIAAGDLGLQPKSPCINTGNNAAIPAGVTTDLAGNPRVSGAVVDMGAYEYQMP